MTDLLASGAKPDLRISDRARENRLFIRLLLAGKQPDFAAALEAAALAVARAEAARAEAAWAKTALAEATWAKTILAEAAGRGARFRDDRDARFADF